jgi:hypothetical protein
VSSKPAAAEKQPSNGALAWQEVFPSTEKLQKHETKIAEVKTLFAAFDGKVEVTFVELKRIALIILEMSAKP